MKKLQSLALILGIISVLVHMYSLFSIMLGFTLELPNILWSLHIGLFICITPAFLARITRINREKDEKSISPQNSMTAIWEGIPMLPYRILSSYSFVVLLHQVVFQSNDETEQWLVFSAFWMLFYYLGWAMLRNEQTHKIAA